MENQSDSKTELIEALSQASRGKNRFKKARLEEVIDEVETAKASGLSHKEIVTVLACRGLVMSEGVFATTRNRILKKRGVEKHKSGQGERERAKVIATSAAPAAPVAVVTPSVSTELDLVRPPGITDVRWSEMKAQARANKRKQNKPK